MESKSYKGGFWLYEASTAGLNWNKKKKAGGKIPEEKTCKKNISHSAKYMVQACFEKKDKFKYHTGKLFFSPALVLKRDNFGRDHILLK